MKLIEFIQKWNGIRLAFQSKFVRHTALLYARLVRFAYCLFCVLPTPSTSIPTYSVFYVISNVIVKRIEAMGSSLWKSLLSGVFLITYSISMSYRAKCTYSTRAMQCDAACKSMFYCPLSFKIGIVVCLSIATSVLVLRSRKNQFYQHNTKRISQRDHVLAICIVGSQSLCFILPLLCFQFSERTYPYVYPFKLTLACTDVYCR